MSLFYKVQFKLLHVSALFTKPSSGRKSIKGFIDKNEISLKNNKLQILYYIIHCIVSSIKTYDLMMA